MNKRIKKKKGLSKITARECWSLDYTLAKYILPRLIKYKEICRSYPVKFQSVEEWQVVIDKMIWSFNILSKDGWSYNMDIYKDKEQYKRYDEGMHLFAEYFADLSDQIIK